MEKYPLPQFIESEGKIIYFLTFRQFFELVGGGAIIYILHLFITNFNIFSIVALAIAGFTAAIAFMKIENTSLPTFFLHFLGFSIESKNYVWKKKEASYPLQARKESAVSEEPGKSMLKMQESGLGKTKKMVETKKPTV